MAARIPYIMPRFDRDTPHVVLRPFELDGRMLAPGSAFDRSRVTVRLHRLLYEQRKIGPSRYLDGLGLQEEVNSSSPAVNTSPPLQTPWPGASPNKATHEPFRPTAKDIAEVRSGVSASNEGGKINIAPVRHLEARSAKFGKWAVFDGDVKVSKLMTEDQARQLALTMAQCPA